MRSRILSLLAAGTLSLIFAACSTGPESWGSWPAYEGEPAGHSAFIRTDGSTLVTPEGSPYLIRGISFGNHVWGNPPTNSGFTHHGPEDYPRARSMGFNSVRFYINYGLFEDDSRPSIYKQDGFTWLDKNIASARLHDIRLIINMHYPQGGFQSNGNGDALWTNRNNQLRLVALWKEIAKRYRDEEFILGYGLVNEPVPLTGVAQWTSLAQEIIDAIRSEDAHHILFVERANWLKGGETETDRNNNYFPIGLNDPGPHANIVYEFHMYDPIQFTHQNASWIPSFVGQYCTYPDTSRIVARNEQWKGFTSGNPTAPTGTFGWTTLTGNPSAASNADYRIGRPVIQASGIGSTGSIWVDDIVVEEYDASDNFIATLWNSSVDSIAGWGFWSSNGSGSGSFDSSESGASGNKCLVITGTTSDANFGNDVYKFIITQGHKYKITGRVKGQNITSSATVRFRVDFYSCDGDIHAWNKAYLADIISSYGAYSTAHTVPVYLGEFGAIRYSFDENSGGITWLADLLDILVSGGINYNYHTWHESNFGLFANDTGFPDPAYERTIVTDLFREKQLQDAGR